MTTPHEATQAPDVTHSPLLWSLGQPGDWIIDANGELVDIRTFAAFIVTAVNAYDALIQQRAELLAALKAIDALPSEMAGDAWAIARRAIANAERGINGEA